MEIAYRESLPRPVHLCRGQNDVLSIFEFNGFVINESAGSDFRPLRIQHYCYRYSRFHRRLTYHAHAIAMFFVIPVREIESCNIHSGMEQILQ
jgi:hypothetical protein